VKLMGKELKVGESRCFTLALFEFFKSLLWQIIYARGMRFKGIVKVMPVNAFMSSRASSRYHPRQAVDTGKEGEQESLSL